MRKLLAALAVSLLWITAASAQIVGTLPFNLTNGTIADANQVMSNFNTIVSAVNSNAATAGANSNITALNGLTTPIVYTSGGSSIYIGGTSSGSSNAYVVASPIPNGWSLITGKVVHFIANFSNNGPTTLQVAGGSALNFFRQTTSGAVAMVGGEILNGQTVWAEYDGTEYQCLNCAQPSLVPTGTVLDFSGPVVPAGYLKADGSTANRTTQSILFNALAFTSVSATTTNTSTSVVVPNSALFQIGWFVGGNNVTCNVTITAIPDGTHITISAAAGAGGATTLTIGPYQQGDCSTTFNLPNYTGKITAGVDGSTNITSTTCTNPATIGDKQTGGQPCGAQTVTLVTGNLPPYTPAGSVLTSGLGSNVVGAGSGASGAQSGSSFNVYTTGAFSLASFVGTAQGGTSTPVNKMPSTALVYKIIKT